MSTTPLHPEQISYRNYLDVNVYASGLPALAERLRSKSCTIGYAGGSNSVTPKGWRGYFHTWLNQTFPDQAPHRSISAAIGATPGSGGCFVAPRYFGDESFDLIFIEYTGNDQNRVEYGELGPEDVRFGIESLIRLFRTRYPGAELCILSIVSLDTTRDGPSDVSSTEYNIAGTAYGVPVINASEFARRLHAEDVEISCIYLPDHYHLPELGVRTFGTFIAESVLHFMDAPDQQQPSSFPDDPALLQHPNIMTITQPMVPPGIPQSQFTSSIFPDGESYWELRPGHSLEFTLEGDLHGLYVIAHPTVGCVNIEVDGQHRYASLFDRWCTNPPKPRMKIVVFDKPLSSNGGRVTAELMDHVPEPPVLAASTPPAAPPHDWAFDVIGVMVDGLIRA